jgi:hypothetical protein
VSASAATIHRADAVRTRRSEVNSEIERPLIVRPFKHERKPQTTS